MGLSTRGGRGRHVDLRGERGEQRVDIVTRRGEHLPARRELVCGRGDEEDLRAVVDAAALYAARRVAVPRGVGLHKDERGLRNIEQLQEAPEAPLDIFREA